jgi:hypothetical protein
MTTPIEKAKELLKKSLPLAHDWEADNVIVAKKIATLCVDEIMTLECLTDEAWLSVPQEYKVQYWKEVRSEIEKLDGTT